ncbi:MAG: hypothetical protein JKY52_05885 [Flavobacteriales bacterium]|nr:hypothetical protein [Flavobacteriales bacterium]
MSQHKVMFETTLAQNIYRAVLNEDLKVFKTAGLEEEMTKTEILKAYTFEDTIMEENFETGELEHVIVASMYTQSAITSLKVYQSIEFDSKKGSFTANVTSAAVMGPIWDEWGNIVKMKPLFWVKF